LKIPEAFEAFKAEAAQIYFTFRDRQFAGVTPGGTIAWSEWLSGEIEASPTVGKDGTIYVACSSHLNAIVPTNAAPPSKSPWPMFRGNPQHTGRVE
jgi:hypothetical protein